MTLRARISAIVILGFLLVATIAALAVGAWNAEKDARYLSTAQQAQAALWRELAEGRLREVELFVASQSGRAELRAALESRSRERIVAALDGGFRLTTGQLVHVDIHTPDGELAHSSSEAAFPVPLLSSTAYEAVLGANGIQRGVQFAQERGLVILAATAIRRQDGTLIGMVAAAAALDDLLDRFASATSSGVVVASLRGRALAGNAVSEWQALDIAPSVIDATSQRLQAGGRAYMVVASPVAGLASAAAIGPRIADLYSLRDLTAERVAERRVMLATSAAAAGVALVLLGILSLHLRGTFRPLVSAIGVLDSLSQGNTGVTVAGVDRRDEVGDIARSIETFRGNTIQLARLRRSRQRQRVRQQRLIRSEMAALARTIDEPDRSRILEDIAEIERLQAEATGDDDSTSLIATAFERLSNRVIDQQERLRGLVGELRAALATKTAYEVLQQELDIARRIQASALPRPLAEQIGFQVAGRMIPVKEIGGDFFDYFRLPDGRLAIAVGDASGKGVAAAFFMATTRTLLRSLAALVPAPAETLARVNDMVTAENDECMFVTLFYGVFDPATGVFDHACAGHNPPMLRGADGGVSTLSTGEGIALGIMPGAVFEQRRVVLEPGACVVLYTDGVTEAIDPRGAFYGEERLVASLASTGRAGAEETMERIVADVRAFEAGATSADDITVLVCARART